MNYKFLKLKINSSYGKWLFNLIALLIVYLLPAIAEITKLPLYNLEPLRLLLILSIAHTSEKNTYFLAIALPAFSLIISGHPYLVKTILLAADLLINAFLFYRFSKYISTSHVGLIMLMSIVLSKIIYYLSKFILIYFNVITGDLITTPVFVQLLVALIFSGYIFIVKGKRKLVS